MNDVRPFEEYKEMIQDMSKEEMIKGLYDLSKNVIEKDKKIERLKKYEKEALDTLESETYKNINLIVEVDRLKNIIKEAREYIEDNTYEAYGTEYMDLTGIKELLEILDKVGDEK